MTSSYAADVTGSSGNEGIYDLGSTSNMGQDWDTLGQSQSPCISTIFRSQPDRVFTIQDIVSLSGKSYDSVRRSLARLAGSGKGSGQIRRISQGCYRFDPDKKPYEFSELVRSGAWKIENVAFKKTVPTPPRGSMGHNVTQPSTPSFPLEFSHNKPGYPQHLPTGQEVRWIQHRNGAEQVWVSANGAPPLNTDAILTIIHYLEKDGMNPDEWVCDSTEYNVDDTRYSFPCGQVTVQAFTGIYLKAYQHGEAARVELADRRTLPVKDMISAVTTISESVDRARANRVVDDLEARMTRLERHIYQRGKPPAKVTTRNQPATSDDLPGFRTAAQIKEEGR